MNIHGSLIWQMFLPSWVPHREKQVRRDWSWQGCWWDSSFPPFVPFYSLIHPYGLVCEYSSSHQLSVALPPCLTVWIGVQTITLLVSLYLPLCSPLFSLFLTPPTTPHPYSLSYCGGLQCSPNPDWSSVIGLTLSSPARGGISYCSDSILSSLPVTVTSCVGL